MLKSSSQLPQTLVFRHPIPSLHRLLFGLVRTIVSGDILKEIETLKSHWNMRIRRQGVMCREKPRKRKSEARAGRSQGIWEERRWGFPHSEEKVWGPLSKMETQGLLQSPIIWSPREVAQPKESGKSTTLICKKESLKDDSCLCYAMMISLLPLWLFLLMSWVGAQLTFSPPHPLLFNLWSELGGYCRPLPGRSSLLNPLWIYLQTRSE